VSDEEIPPPHLTSGDDDRAAVDGLLPLVYDELRLLARGLLAGDGGSRTLDTTSLVHEAYLKLARNQNLPAHGRRYFFGAAVRAMRQVLVDEARRRRSSKRGGDNVTLALAGCEPAAPAVDPDLFEVDAALERLAAAHPRPARVVECRFFGGLSIEETAAALAVSPRTVKRDWSLAQAWLYHTLRSLGLERRGRRAADREPATARRRCEAIPPHRP
jgi:RNA polymerase sigma factor (TIGR02999 family)